MAPKTIPAIKWHINFGAERCERHKGTHPYKLTVHLEHANENVITDYEFGCHGVVVRSDQTVGEAIEWLRDVQRQWSGHERQFGTIIEGLSKFQD